MDRELTPGSFWKHNKRQTTYEIVGIARSQVDENENDMVVYKATHDGQLWVRPLTVFLDSTDGVNRFDKIKESEIRS